MARVSWRGDLRKLQSRIENLPEDMLDMAEEILEDETARGAAEMKAIIERSNTETGIREGRTGRVKSGKMRDDVEHATKRFRRSVRGEFGWGVNGGTVQDYYGYQENGFKHWRSGKDVSPMHAQLESFMHFRERFFGRMRSEMRRRRG